jgi:hypothetical protein
MPSSHPNDLERFYNFVWAVRRYGYWKDGRKRKRKEPTPTDDDVYKAIIKARRGSVDADTLETEARKYQLVFHHLIAFSRTANESKPLIEKKDVKACYWELTKSRATQKEIKSFMLRAFGPGWVKKCFRSPSLAHPDPVKLQEEWEAIEV